MRDLFMTARSFIKRLNAFLKYRNATKDMNSKFADATAEEIQREDTCIICREVMRPWAATNAETPAANAGGAGAGRRMVRAAQTNERLRPKKLPCGHVLHLGCLKSWLERQQFCPTCRRPVIERSSTVNNPAPIPAQPQVQAAANAAREAIPAAPRERAPQPQIVINREINIGPLRLAFGRGVLPAGVAVPNAPQARVIGLGVEAGPARRNVPRPSPAGTHAHQQPHSESGGADDVSIEANIRRLERQINDEASRLDLHRSELAILRQLQEELTRLRTTRIMSGVGHMIPETAGIYGAAYAQPSQSGGGPFVGSQGRLVPSVRGLGGVRTITTHRFAPIPGQVAIPSGSPDLPPGVAIPSGWNLLPLQNADATERNVSSSTPVVRTSMSTSTVPPNTTETSGVALAAATVSSATTGPDQAASSVQCPESQPEQELISDPAAQGTQPEQASDTATQENSPAVPSAENAPTDQSTAPADDDDDMFQNWGSSPPLPRTAGVDSGMSTPAVAAIPEPVRFDFGNINNNVSSGADATPSGEGQRSSSGINEADLPVLPRTEGIDDGMSTPGSFRMPLRSSPEESRNKGKGKEKQPSVEDDNEARGSGR